jgi:DNA-binding transcriptional ArsR family regulator
LTGNHKVAYFSLVQPPTSPAPPDEPDLPDDDRVFRALADSHRRVILDRLYGRNGQTLAELCAEMGMTRQAVSKHVAVLVEAGLISTRRQGRERLHHLNPVPISRIYHRWIRKYEQPRLDALDALRTNLEGPSRP